MCDKCSGSAGLDTLNGKVVNTQIIQFHCISLLIMGNTCVTHDIMLFHACNNTHSFRQSLKLCVVVKSKLYTTVLILISTGVVKSGLPRSQSESATGFSGGSRRHGRSRDEQRRHTITNGVDYGLVGTHTNTKTNTRPNSVLKVFLKVTRLCFNEKQFL